MATSCFDKAKPNYQFFPNMYEAVPYETYSEHEVFKDLMESKDDFVLRDAAGNPCYANNHLFLKEMHRCIDHLAFA